MSSLNNINLTGGTEPKIYPPSGFSYSGMLEDKSTSIFVKCQLIMLWFIVILIIIMGIIGHKKARQHPGYSHHNPIIKTTESVMEGFNEIFG